MSIDSHAHAAADLRDRSILGHVEIPASAERVFRALTSEEIKNWWIRPGVFNTTDWAGERLAELLLNEATIGTTSASPS